MSDQGEDKEKTQPESSTEGNGDNGEPETPLEKILAQLREKLENLQDPAEIQQVLAQAAKATSDYQGFQSELDKLIKEYADALPKIQGEYGEIQNYFDLKAPYIDGQAGGNQQKWREVRRRYDAELKTLEEATIPYRAQAVVEAQAQLDTLKRRIERKKQQIKDLKGRKAALQARLNALKALRDRIEKQEEGIGKPDSQAAGSMFFLKEELEALLTTVSDELLESGQLQEQLYELWSQLNEEEGKLPAQEKALATAKNDLKAAEDKLKKDRLEREANILAQINPPKPKKQAIS